MTARAVLYNSIRPDWLAGQQSISHIIATRLFADQKALGRVVVQETDPWTGSAVVASNIEKLGFVGVVESFQDEYFVTPKEISVTKNLADKVVITSNSLIVTKPEDEYNSLMVAKSKDDLFKALDSILDCYGDGKLQPPKLLIIPVNINNRHWTLLTVNIAEKKAHYVDTLSWNENNIKEYFEVNKKFSYQEHKESIQKDGKNCGFYSAKAGEILAREALEIDPDPDYPDIISMTGHGDKIREEYKDMFRLVPEDKQDSPTNAIICFAANKLNSEAIKDIKEGDKFTANFNNGRCVGVTKSPESVSNNNNQSPQKPSHSIFPKKSLNLANNSKEKTIEQSNLAIVVGNKPKNQTISKTNNPNSKSGYNVKLALAFAAIMCIAVLYFIYSKEKAKGKHSAKLIKRSFSALLKEHKKDISSKYR